MAYSHDRIWQRAGHPSTQALSHPLPCQSLPKHHNRSGHQHQIQIPINQDPILPPSLPILAKTSQSYWTSTTNTNTNKSRLYITPILANHCQTDSHETSQTNTTTNAFPFTSQPWLIYNGHQQKQIQKQKDLTTPNFSINGI